VPAWDVRGRPLARIAHAPANGGLPIEMPTFVANASEEAAILGTSVTSCRSAGPGGARPPALNGGRRIEMPTFVANASEEAAILGTSVDLGQRCRAAVARPV
jgi:hypothetical protein